MSTALICIATITLSKRYMWKRKHASRQPFLNSIWKHVPEKDELEKCARRQGCFQIRDVMNLKAKRITRFEIWGGCTSHIDKFALYSARSRLGYLCTTPDMEKVAKYGTKCLAVETGNYFSMTLFPPVNRTFYEDVEKTAKDSGEKIENYLVICCCAQACDDKEAKKYAEYYLYRKE
ncbi:hypothetical protein Ddc_15612 [Ditylenchus destructor]|nr:hypothetical protein Ddc_15612 [Ditylenchus destructor]